MIKIKTGSFSLKGSKLSVPRFESLSNNEIVIEDSFEDPSLIVRSIDFQVKIELSNYLTLNEIDSQNCSLRQMIITCKKDKDLKKYSRQE